ncbi:flagellar hook capping FlgD N-terminal domain-containing protein [Rhodanobacter sp. AS-Z3]|uniref:flagellar hook assembly protein FlgD n=1 Tax=Rhodanobacter sp. AS-Z3 TaxID=3031330 RepID=UPI00247AED74|nr:flagellar hook capping FlgD N-terminal domain-containing protein [Rhodanobacter sp. AS-Z3]WEN14627.1 flagellar hook capping FlgD N-terminal domain-containing protein [Rhodanobacter sp. AS-Z3]
MSDIAIGGPATSATQAVTKEANKTMNQADFLSLLVQQMRNQDPTKPTDSSQMVSQLAQINQVSATQALQTSFDALSKSMQGNQLLQASSMVGRSVVVPSAAGTLQDAGLDGAVNVPADAGDVLVQVTDSAGNVLRTINMGRPQQGLAPFHWDGKGDDGSALPNGAYGLKAQVGNTAVNTYVSGRVNGVGMTGADGAYLDVDGFGGVLLSQVAQIN